MSWVASAAASLPKAAPGSGDGGGDRGGGILEEIGTSAKELKKEIASLLIGTVLTYFTMRALFYMLDPQKEEKAKGQAAKQSALKRLGLTEGDSKPPILRPRAAPSISISPCQDALTSCWGLCRVPEVVGELDEYESTLCADGNAAGTPHAVPRFCGSTAHGLLRSAHPGRYLRRVRRHRWARVGQGAEPKK